MDFAWLSLYKMSKMKILQINNYHHVKGGSDTVYLSTGKLLEKMGHEVIYFSTSSVENIQDGKKSYLVPTEDPNEGGVLTQLKKIPSFIYSRSNYRSLKAVLKKEKPDVAHLHIFYGRLTSSILKALKEESIPTVMSVHEYRMLCPVSVFMSSKGEICEKCAGKNYIPCVTSKCNKGSYAFSSISAIESTFRDIFFDYKKYIDHFIMVSQFIQNKHREYFPGIEKKSSILYNFQNLNNINISKPKEVDLVFFGRLSREKGILTLLNAIRENKNISLKIIGTGPEEETIRKFVKTNSLNKVNLLGFRQGDDLWNHIASARFVVVPSECYENNPMTVIESLFLGVPVIGSNIGGIPEIVKKDHGLIFKPGNVSDLKKQIEVALEIPANTYTKMELSAKDFANHKFSEGNHYKKLIKIYNKVLQ